MSEHLYIRRNDPQRARPRFRRELHVCRSVRDGVHLAVQLDQDGPPPGAPGHRPQIAAGLNITRGQARKLIQHLFALLDEEE